MAEFPLDPMLSKTLIAASTQYFCVNEVLSIVSMLSVPNIFHRPKDQQADADHSKKKFIHQDGDHLTMLNAYNAFMSKGMNNDWCWDNYLNYRALK